MAFRRFSLVLAGSLAAAALAGCRPTPEPASVIPPLAGTEPNGEQQRTGTQLVADARSAVRRALVLELTGTLPIAAAVPQVDLVVGSDGSLSGTLTQDAGSLQVQLSTAAVYLRSTGMTGQLVAALGLPPIVATTAPGAAFWQIAPADASSLVALAQPDLAATLLPSSLDASPQLTSGDVNGTPVVSAAAPSATVSVAVTGSTRLVQLTQRDAGASVGVTTLEVDTITSTPPPPLPTPAAVSTPSTLP